MNAHDAQATLMEGLGFAMAPVLLSLLLAVATSIAGRMKRRRVTPVPAFIPQQRTGGESGAR